MRLQKYMAMCGVASRRKSEELIAKGLVKVNGEVVTKLGTVVEDSDKVEYQGNVIALEGRLVYIALNKPKNVITAVSDDHDRTTVSDLVKDEIKERIYPVGRLDYDSEGLLLMTNDGELAHKLMHPSFNVEKEYIVDVNKTPDIKSFKALQHGVYIDDDYKTKPAKVDWIKDRTLSITISEGRNRQVRKMCEAVDLNVINLTRVAIGKILLGNIPYGRWRHLTKGEIEYLKEI